MHHIIALQYIQLSIHHDSCLLYRRRLRYPYRLDSFRSCGFASTIEAERSSPSLSDHVHRVRLMQLSCNSRLPRSLLVLRILFFWYFRTSTSTNSDAFFLEHSSSRLSWMGNAMLQPHPWVSPGHDACDDALHTCLHLHAYNTR